MQSPNVFPEWWKFGTQERETRGTVISLSVYTSPTAGQSKYSTLRLAGATSGYQVPTGQTLIITRALYNATAGGNSLVLGYADTDVGIDANAAGTNHVFLDNNSGAARGIMHATTAEANYDREVYYEVPATKYADIFAGANGNWSAMLQLLGVLV